MRLGMRTIKTGLGIFLSLWICSLLGFERGALAAITVIVGLQPSLIGSLKTIKNQILATTIGCIIALTLTYFFQGNLLLVFISLAAIFTIWVCVKLGWQESVTMALVTIILVTEAPDGNFLTVAQNRIIMIIIGLFMAFILNVIIPPQHTSRLILKVDELRKVFEEFYNKCIDEIVFMGNLSRQEVKDYSNKIKDLIYEAREIYILSKESNIFYNDKKEDHFLVRKSINAIQSNLERLLEINHSITSAPMEEKYRDLRQAIHLYLSAIFNCHQKIYNDILYGKKIDEKMFSQFIEQRKNLEVKILELIKDADDLQPLHFYNMLAEGERIMKKAWSLIEKKEKITLESS